MARFFEKLWIFGLIFLACLQTSTASSQSYLSPGYIFGEIRQGLGFYSVPDAPDFVKKARPNPTTLEYVPLQPPPRDFHQEAAKPEKRIEAESSTIAELEAARASSQKRAKSATNLRSRALQTNEDESSSPMKWNGWDPE